MSAVQTLTLGAGGLLAAPAPAEAWWQAPWLLLRHGRDGDSWTAIGPSGAVRFDAPRAQVIPVDGGFVIHTRGWRLHLGVTVTEASWSPFEPEALCDASARWQAQEVTWWIADGYAWRQRSDAPARALARANRLVAGPNGSAAIGLGDSWRIIAPEGPPRACPDASGARFSADGWRVGLAAGDLDLRTGRLTPRGRAPDTARLDADGATLTHGILRGATCAIPGLAAARPARDARHLFGPGAGFWSLDGAPRWLGRPNLPSSTPAESAAPLPNGAWVLVHEQRLYVTRPGDPSPATPLLPRVPATRVVANPDGVLVDSEEARWLITCPGGDESVFVTTWSGRWPRPGPVVVDGHVIGADGLFSASA